MPAQVALLLSQNNDETLHGTVTAEDTDTPQDLTGVTLTLLIKPSKTTADDDPAVHTLTPTVDSAPAGTYTVAVPAALLDEAGSHWYRVDATQAGKTRTIVYGPLNVRDL